MRSLFRILAVVALWSWSASGPARSPRVAPIPVLDLRLGLAGNWDDPRRNLWKGMGQGGIVQLRQGHVVGALAPFPIAEWQLPEPASAVRFAALRVALASTQVLDLGGCAAPPSRIATWFELEAPDWLASDPDSVRTWIARGVRVVALAGRRSGALASSAFEQTPPVTGLTRAGRRVVEAASNAGALIDVANVSDLALAEILELARSRGSIVIATRGSARAVRSRPGSFDDAQLRAIARSGGVIGLSLARDLIGDAGDSDLSDVLRQVDHLLEVAGLDAVAIASGYETGAVPASALKSAARFPRLADALVARGVAPVLVRKLFFENAARVLCGLKPFRR